MKLKSRFSLKDYERNAEIYKALGSSKRLAILNSICYKEATVDQLSELLGMRKANTSQHLFVLRHLGLVKVRREGRNSFYKITHPGIVGPCEILNNLRKKRHL